MQEETYNEASRVLKVHNNDAGTLATSKLSMRLGLKGF
jgi:hypothetical protein